MFWLLNYCCWMCAGISIWGSLQLGAMSIFYFTESVGLIEDCEAHNPKNYSDFIERTKKNYKATGTNCMIAAAVYVLTLLLSIGCIWRARKEDKLKAVQLEDDEISCLPPPPKPEIMVKHEPRTGVLAKLLRKKGKQSAPPPVQNRLFGAIDSQDMDVLKDEKQVQEKPAEEVKKKKKKKDKKKKKKRGQD